MLREWFEWSKKGNKQYERRKGLLRASTTNLYETRFKSLEQLCLDVLHELIPPQLALSKGTILSALRDVTVVYQLAQHFLLASVDIFSCECRGHPGPELQETSSTTLSKCNHVFQVILQRNIEQRGSWMPTSAC